MTVRELRDKLNELIAKDESYGDAPVYYDDDELDLMPPEFLNGNNEKTEEALEYIANKIAEDVFKFNFEIEMNRHFKGAQYTDEIKYTLEIYRNRFEEKVEEEFYQTWYDKLLKSFMPWDVRRILKMAKTTPLRISLSGDKEDMISF